MGSQPLAAHSDAPDRRVFRMRATSHQHAHSTDGFVRPVAASGTPSNGDGCTAWRSNPTRHRLPDYELPNDSLRSSFDFPLALLAGTGIARSSVKTLSNANRVEAGCRLPDREPLEDGRLAPLGAATSRVQIPRFAYLRLTGGRADELLAVKFAAKVCRLPDLNRGQPDLQSSALPV